MKMTFRVYGRFDGTRHHRHRCSFEPSRDLYFERDGGISLHEACFDETGTNDYVDVTITAATEYLCVNEILGQDSDGLYENCNTGDIVEIETGRIIDYDLLNELRRKEIHERMKEGKKMRIDFMRVSSGLSNVKDSVKLLEEYNAYSYWMNRPGSAYDKRFSAEIPGAEVRKTPSGYAVCVGDAVYDSFLEQNGEIMLTGVGEPRIYAKIIQESEATGTDGDEK